MIDARLDALYLPAQRCGRVRGQASSFNDVETECSSREADVRAH
jgi:hypothetical protein